MNGTNPNCDKTPVMAAVEDTLVVFVYSLLVALSAVLIIDDFNSKVLVMPIITAGVQGCITWARVRNVQLPAQKDDNGGEE